MDEPASTLPAEGLARGCGQCTRVAHTVQLQALGCADRQLGHLLQVLHAPMPYPLVHPLRLPTQLHSIGFACSADDSSTSPPPSLGLKPFARRGKLISRKAPFFLAGTIFEVIDRNLQHLVTSSPLVFATVVSGRPFVMVGSLRRPPTITTPSAGRTSRRS